jgi:hypothetical protein
MKGEPKVSRRVKFSTSAPLAGSRRGWSMRCTWLSPCTSSTSPAKLRFGQQLQQLPVGPVGRPALKSSRSGLACWISTTPSSFCPRPPEGRRHPRLDRRRCAGELLRGLRCAQLLPLPGTLRVTKSTGPICQRWCSR